MNDDKENAPCKRAENAIGSLVSLALAALVAAPGQAEADSALLEEAVGLSGLAMFMEWGATGMVLAVVRGDDGPVIGSRCSRV